jgi:outer membrane protein OmpA-like peptidoglycan-associated protein
MAIVIGGLGLGLSGCAADGGSTFGVFATEEWVRNRDREQEDRLQAALAKIDSRLAQHDTRLTQVTAQTGEARKVADEGIRKADAVNGRLSQSLADQQKRVLVESTSLQFATGKFGLQPDHVKSLDEVYEKLTQNPTYTADIVGQADARGAKQDNSLLSWRRTEHVRRYLAEKGGVLHRISFIGMGEDMANGPKTEAEHRRVNVVIFRPISE